MSKADREKFTPELIEFFKNQLRSNKPYDEDDPELQIWDNPRIDPYRIRATNAKRLLVGAGIDISDIMAKWETERLD